MGDDKKKQEKYVPTSNFVHLHVHSDYSILDGAAQIPDLISRAKELGFGALALTDHGNMFGVLRFEQLCHKEGINPLVGCEFYVAPGERHDKKQDDLGNRYYHLVLIAKNIEGYKNLSWLCSKGYTEGMYYKPRIDLELLKKYSSGLICLTACLAGELPKLLLANKNTEAEEFVNTYRNIFGKDNFFIELQDHGIPEQKKVAPLLINIAQKMNVPMVVTNDSHYVLQEDAIAQDVLVCIGTKKLRSDTNRMKFATDQFYLKSEEEMKSLFPQYPEMIENTKRIADMCDLTIPQYKTQELKDCLPIYQIPSKFANQDEYVRHIVYDGLIQRYGEITPQIKERVEYELGIIFQMGFSGYFLIVWDFINWSKTHDIPIGPGRGSGAGSLVAYAMSITDIDPFRFKLIFERFLNPERVSMPDFDIDMCFEGRQEIIQYTREHYGDPQVGHIVTFGTLKPKAAIADVGRVLGTPLSDVNMLKKLVPEGMKVHLADGFAEPNEKHPDFGQLKPYREDPRFKELFDIAFKLEGVKRNTSLHASGLVIGRTELPDWTPIYKDSKTGKVASQYTMDIIEPCGLVKFDYLGLKTLTLIKYAEHIIRKRKGLEDFKANEVSDTDDKTFDLFCRGDTTAVFQFESAGMQKILKQAQPRCLEEIVALNALYRPGPMAYIPQYIEGKFDHSKIHYPDPCLEDVLKETYGVMVYQEQVMQVAQKIAGFSLGEADILRRAMGKKKIAVLMEKKKEFVEGALKNGHTKEHAEEIFEIMIPFAGYGFNKSHAAAYSVVAYRTAWLKANYPAEFIAANLTNEINSTDKLPVYIDEGRRMGLEIDPPDVNRSDKIFDVVDGNIVYGLLGIKGLGETAAEEIIKQRKKEGKYTDFMNFLERVDLHTVNKRALEVLIRTGAFDKLGINRPTLLNNYERAVEYADSKKAATAFGQVSLFADTDVQEFSDFTWNEVEDWPQLEKLRLEKELIGFYISGHPLDQYKKALETSATINSTTIDRARAEKQYVAIGMIKSIREINTKKGKLMAFGILEDFNGTIDLTFFPNTWEKLRGTFKDDDILAISGKVDLSRDTPSILVDELKNPDELEEKSVKEIHIQLDPNITDKKELYDLEDFLIGFRGSCAVFFHILTKDGEYTIQASQQTCVQNTEEFIQKLSEQLFVENVWSE